MTAHAIPTWDAALWKRGQMFLDNWGTPEVAEAMTCYAIRFELGKRHQWPPKDIAELLPAKERLVTATQLTRAIQ